ncbi:DUF6730 family protein [Galbibacter orientalis]|uniref:DUF6730 family protein n=1 Tax=Galbibacter orientalis TaxID=453852 RepID=UPI0030804904
MAKLEEIAALLTEEIEGFNLSVAKLEALAKKLHKVKVKADTSQIEDLLETHLNRQAQFEEAQATNTRNLIQSMDKSKLFPKWIVVCSIIYIVLLSVLGFSTLSYRHTNQQLKDENARIKKHYQSFIKESPEIEAQYLNWIYPPENQAK